MITKKTVLVLGAGASYAYGFPSGLELKDKIYSLISSGYAKSFNLDENDAKEFRNALVRTPVYSIDAFLERRPEFIGIGKKFISIALLPHERTEALFEDITSKRIGSRQKNNILAVEDWYQYLFNLLGNDPEQFQNNKLVVITFNYDRSIEHYIYEGLKNSFKLDNESCRQAISSIQFIHVYGSLGKLPWQNGEIHTVPYDGWKVNETRISLVNNAAESIKILHENPDNTPEFEQARKEIQSAEKVLFLGFGFHTINVKRLLPGDLIKKNDMYGTSKGLDVHKKYEMFKLGIQGFHKGLQAKCFPDTTILEFLTRHSVSNIE